MAVAFTGKYTSKLFGKHCYANLPQLQGVVPNEYDQYLAK